MLGGGALFLTIAQCDLSTCQALNLRLSTLLSVWVFVGHTYSLSCFKGALYINMSSIG